MRKILLTLVLLLASFYAGCNKVPADVVATVDDREIKEEEFNKEYDFYVNVYENEKKKEAIEIDSAEDEKELSELKDGVIEKLIIQKVIENEIENLGIEASDTEFKSLKEEKIEALGGPEEFKSFLTELNITEEFFDKALREDFYTQKLREKFIEDNSDEIDEKKLIETFEKNKEKFYLYDFKLIEVETENEANNIMISALPFEKQAVLHSKDVESASMGGEVKNYSLGTREKAIDNFLLENPVSDQLNIVKGEKSYYVISIEDKKEDFESLREVIKNSVLEREFYNYLENIRKNAKVKIFTK